MALNLTTLNIRGLSSEWKQQHTKEFLCNIDCEIFLLQETKISNTGSLHAWKKKCGPTYSIYHSAATSNASGGVMTGIRNSCSWRVLSTRVVVRSRCLDTELTNNHYRLHILNVYAPTNLGERELFFSSLGTYVETLTAPFVLAGDFNCVEDPRVDRLSLTNVDYICNGADVSMLKTVIGQHDILDCWTLQHPNDHGYTFYCNTAASRLDRIYLPNFLCTQSMSVSRSPCMHSDHWAVTCHTMPTSPPPPTRSYWKLNIDLLSDPLWCDDVATYIADMTKTQTINGYTWDIMKQHIARIARSRATKLARERKHSESILEQQYANLVQAMDNGSNCWKELQAVQAKLRRLQEYRMRGAAIRARAQWMANNEAPGKCFYRLERDRTRKKRISSVRTENTLLTDPADITEGVRAHFQRLYGKVPTSRLYLNGLAKHAKQLDERELATLNDPISATELTIALQTMRTNTSPGEDGLPVEFYKRFWGLLQPILVAIVAESIELGRLPPSQRVSLITLVPKAKDPDELCDLSNWRPISLLNVDYKIFTRALVNRMKSWLPDFVNCHQKCAVPGRNIQDINLLMGLLNDWCTQSGTQVAALQLDLKAAFDSVDHEYLFATLANMGVKGYFLHAIRACYNGVVGKVIVNGQLTDDFPIFRSVRQGCPLSMALFILQLDPVLNWIGKEHTIHGISISPDIEVKFVAYADDITLLLTTRRSIQNALRIFHGYELATGMTVNKHKSKGFWIGDWPQTPAMYLDIPWTTDGIEILGIWVGKPCIRARNWENTLQKVTQHLSYWNGRRLSFWGRINVWNTYILPTLTYRALPCVFPPTLLAKLDRQAALFVWKKKYEPARRETLTFPKKEGGLGLISVTRHVQARNILSLQRMMHTTYSPLRALLQKWVQTDNILDVTSPNSLGTRISLPAKLTEMIKCVRQSVNAIEDHDPATWTTRFLYVELCRSFGRTPRLASMHGENHASRCIKRIRNLHTLPVVKDFLWKIISNILPTGAWLEDRRMCAHLPDLRCYHCHHREDCEHVLLRCTIAQQLWAHVQQHLDVTPKSIHLLIRELPGLPEHELLLTSCVGIAVWRLRNDVIFRGASPSRGGLEHLYSLLLYHHGVDKERLSETAFKKRWVDTGLHRWLSPQDPCLLPHHMRDNQ